MKKRGQIKNVVVFEKFHEKILFSISNFVYEIDNEFNKQQVLFREEEEIRSLEVYLDKYILINEYKIYKNELISELIQGKEFINISNNILLIRNIDFANEIVEYFSYDIQNNKRLKLKVDNDVIPLILNKDFLINISDNHKNEFIELINLKENVCFQKYPFAELLKNSNATLYSPPQVINNRFFFFLFDSSHQTDEYATFCLDLEKGEILWKGEGFGSWLTTFENKIYAIKDKQVQVLNPETFEVTNLDLREQLSVLDKQLYKPEDKMTWQIPFSFSTSTYVIKDNCLYFTQEKKSTVGIIDLQTKKLLWHIDIEIDSGDIIPIVTDIKVDDTRLCILDSNNTLHIFEKDGRLCNENNSKE